MTISSLLPNVCRGEGWPLRRRLYMFNHIKYDSATLASEYLRDLEAGGPAALPHDYFPDDDPYPCSGQPLAVTRLQAFRKLDQPGLSVGPVLT